MSLKYVPLCLFDYIPELDQIIGSEYRQLKHGKTTRNPHPTPTLSLPNPQPTQPLEQEPSNDDIAAYDQTYDESYPGDSQSGCKSG